MANLEGAQRKPPWASDTSTRLREPNNLCPPVPTFALVAEPGKFYRGSAGEWLLLHFDTGVADDLAPLFHLGTDNTAVIFGRAAQHVVAQF